MPVRVPGRVQIAPHIHLLPGAAAAWYARLTLSPPPAGAEALEQKFIGWDISGYHSLDTELIHITDVRLRSRASGMRRILELQSGVLFWFTLCLWCKYHFGLYLWFNDSMIFTEMRQWWAGWLPIFRLTPAIYHRFWSSRHTTHRNISLTSFFLLILSIFVSLCMRDFPS